MDGGAAPKVYQNNRKTAIICINIFTILQFAFLVGSKLTMKTYNIPGLDYLTIRTLTCLLLDIILVYAYDKTLRVPNQGLSWVIARNAAGTFTVIGLVLAIKYLPLGLYQILYSTAPFWATLMAFILLGEKLSLIEVIAMLVSFVLIVVFAMNN